MSLFQSTVGVSVKTRLECIALHMYCKSAAAIQHVAKRSLSAAYLLTACPSPAYCMGMQLHACMPLATYIVKLWGPAKCNTGLAFICMLNISLLRTAFCR